MSNLKCKHVHIHAQAHSQDHANTGVNTEECVYNINCTDTMNIYINMLVYTTKSKPPPTRLATLKIYISRRRQI